MDFGGLTETAAAKQRWYGSGAAYVKQERSWSSNGDGEDEDLRGFKLGKTNVSAEVFSASRTPLLRSSEAPQGQQMLSFSSPKSAALPYYHHSSISSGYGNGGNVHGGLSGIRGPFTPSQWMELEHQALIYKYINANVPIPSYLLTPIRRALDAAGFTNFAGLRPNAFGWGAFHLGFSNSTDPEPGRCRRTDGKKWRCSRDAVVDQKYCERHMNRGRHRSRKPVEGQSVAGTGTGTGTGVTGNAAAGKFMPALSPPVTVVPGGALAHLQPGESSGNTQCAPTPQLDRSFLGKDNPGGRAYQDPTSSSIISSNVNVKESQSQYPFSKQPDEFGLVCSDSLLNPLDRRCSLVSGNDHGSSKANSSLRQFMDDWPNSSRPERSSISWPTPEIDMHSDRTQLSISIPSDFMSSTSSPTSEKVNNVNASPLRLGVGNIGIIVNEQRAVRRQQGNWIPVAWESSMGGGPLAEVLHSTNTNDSRSLNLMTDGWEGTASPTGVLQKAAFVSRSNSSNGSSPRAVTSKVATAAAHEGASHCSVLLGSTLLNPALPAL